MKASEVDIERTDFCRRCETTERSWVTVEAYLHALCAIKDFKYVVQSGVDKIGRSDILG